MYKDKDKQREANAERQRRYKAKQKALLFEGVTDKALPKRTGVNLGVLNIEAVPNGQGGTKLVAPKRTANGYIRVSKPGDADYEPQCETTRAFIEGRDKRPEAGKRRKDIKCFEDLHPDIQQAIDGASLVDGKIDKTIKANRAAIAINYQHLFPNRYYPTGAII